MYVFTVYTPLLPIIRFYKILPHLVCFSESKRTKTLNSDKKKSIKEGARFLIRTPDFIIVQIAPEMRDGADLVGEDDHGVLAGLWLEYVPDELGEGRLVAHEAQLGLPRSPRQVTPG
jgi:hypothetical protein